MIPFTNTRNYVKVCPKGISAHIDASVNFPVSQTHTHITQTAAAGDMPHFSENVCVLY
jgi:hypothetical protein